jgi:DNA-binding transcriptional LysR family regulator
VEEKQRYFKNLRYKVYRKLVEIKRGEGMTLQQLRYAIMVADCGSMNEAAKRLYISQPSLSGTMKELEEEIGTDIFFRSNRGIVITPEGEEFLGYARQVVDQYRLLENKYIEKKTKKKFSVSMQHYTFAVKAFVEVVKKVGMEQYEFAVHETKTYEVIENVKNFKSELGVLYLNDFNEQVMTKILRENSLEFEELFQCGTYVYLWGEHPLAKKVVIEMNELEEYPCLAFEQGKNNSFYLAEEMMSTYDYKRIIKVDDRATILNLMVGLNGYTLCSGIISEELNGDDYKAIPLLESQKMRIGYIKRRGSNMSSLAELYIEELKKYQDSVL